MTIFKSFINKNSKEFQSNRKMMLGLIGKLRTLEKRAEEYSEKRRKRFVEREQITPRERLFHLLDPGMPFLSLHTLANYLVEDTDPKTSIPGASVICGIGFVSGIRCMIWVDDSGIKAGSWTQMSLPTILSIQDIALKQKLPLIHLVESAGLNLINYNIEGWSEAGGLFYNLARLSASGIPSLAVLHGPSTAGGAYMPGLSDYVVGVKKNGMAALAGAALTQAATGEITTDSDLGGAEMHSEVSGLVEYLANDDIEGIKIARKIISNLNWNRYLPNSIPVNFKEPKYDIEELAGIVPVDYKVYYDVREIVARLVDGSDFLDFKPGYGSSTVCIQSHIFGNSCGIIGNNGPIDPEGATKAAQFLQLCDQSNLPVIFLHNTTGYLVGKEYERAGMIKHGSKMVQAASNVSVPKISIYVGASFGAGNYGMCGKAYAPDFLFAWPNSITGVMGGKQAAKTMTQVIRNSSERRGSMIDEKIIKKNEEKITKHFDKQSNAFYTSGRVLDHGVIDPRDTRKVLGFTLGICLESKNRKLMKNSFGIARM